jgi:hypothetical protein
MAQVGPVVPGVVGQRGIARGRGARSDVRILLELEERAERAFRQREAPRPGLHPGHLRGAAAEQLHARLVVARVRAEIDRIGVGSAVRDEEGPAEPVRAVRRGIVQEQAMYDPTWATVR